jgi:hypothetical protein
LTVVGIAAVVVHLGDLERAEWDLSLGETGGGVDALRFEDGRGDGGDAGDFARGGVDGAEVDGLSEGEGVGREQTLGPVG